MMSRMPMGGMKPGGMKPMGMGAGPKLSEMPMSMPMSGPAPTGGTGGNNQLGSPAFQAGPGAMGRGGGGAAASMGAGNAASTQNYMRNAADAHRANVERSRADTSRVAGQFGIGPQAGSGPRGEGIVPAVKMSPGAGVQRMPMPRGGLSMLSDERSKQRIKELEDVNAQYQAVLGGEPATAGVLESAYQQPTANTYEYKNPGAPGAAPGRQSGPMAQELEGIPGVVRPGPDGMKRVDPARLTMTNASQIGNLTRAREQDRAEIDALKAHLDALGMPDEKLSYASGMR